LIHAFNWQKRSVAIAVAFRWYFQRSGLCFATRPGSDHDVTVGGLIRLLRHSVAHGHVTFDSDSRRPEEVRITFENYLDGSHSSNWRGSIRADMLACFCRKYSDFVADRVE